MQGNNGASASIPYEPGVSNAQPATTSIETPAVHNGQDPFVVTVTFSDRVRPPRSAGGPNLGYWLANQLVVLNGYAQSFPDPSYVSFPTTELQFMITPDSEASVMILQPSNTMALPGNTFSRARVSYGAGTDSPSLATIYGDAVHPGPTGRGSTFDGILVTIQFSKEMPGIESLRYWQVVRVYGGTVLNSKFSTPFTSTSTTYAQMQVVPDGTDDIVIQVPENVLGDDGVQNVASSKTITYTPPPALVILSGPDTHQGSSSIVRVVASFDRPVTGVTSTCVTELRNYAVVQAVHKEDDEGREWSFDLMANSKNDLQLQVGETCVSSTEGNYASRILELDYTPPPPAGAPARVSIVAPALHDAAEPIEVVFQWNKGVKQFGADDIVVSPSGVMRIGGLTADPTGAIYNLPLWFSMPMRPSSQVNLNITVKAGSVETGNPVASTRVMWDQYGPTPSPPPMPSPPCDSVSCSGHGQCSEIMRPGSMYPSAQCSCEAGYGGFACSYPLSSNACADDRQDGDESDVDCGGSCRPCAEGLSCMQPSDCDLGADCFADVQMYGGYRSLRALTYGDVASPGTCLLATIANVTTDSVKVSWALRGLDISDASGRVTAALRHRVQRYINKGYAGAPVPSVLYRLSQILVSKIQPWTAPSPPAPPALGATTNATDGVAVTLQVVLDNNSTDIPIITASLRNALASGIVATHLQTDLPGVPIGSVEDPGDGSGDPSVSSPRPAPSTLPPIPSPGASPPKKDHRVAIEVAAGVAGGALVVGLVAGALVMYCRQQSDSQRLAARLAAETTG